MREANKGREAAVRILVILFVLLLMAAALLSPLCHNYLYDKKTLGKMRIGEESLNIYIAPYHFFSDRIAALAVASRDRRLQAYKLQLGDDVAFLSPTEERPVKKAAREEAARIVNSELKELSEKVEGFSDYAVTVKSSELKSLTRFTITSTPADENLSFSGIDMYKAEFSNKEYSLAVYYDSEFRKIYYLERGTKMRKNSGDSYDIRSLEKAAQKKFSNWWYGIREYYGLTEVHLQSQMFLESILEPSEKLTGYLEYSGKYRLPVCQGWEKQHKQLVYYMGIPLEKIVRF